LSYRARGLLRSHDFKQPRAHGERRGGWAGPSV